MLNDPKDPEHHADLIVNFEMNPFKANSTNYRVLDTDYENFSIVYNCLIGRAGFSKFDYKQFDSLILNNNSMF